VQTKILIQIQLRNKFHHPGRHTLHTCTDNRAQNREIDKTRELALKSIQCTCHLL